MKSFSKMLLPTIVMFLNFAVMAATNLNTASLEEIQKLPGVGANVAQEIVKARPFKSVDDLKNVKGIGDLKFSALKNLVTVDAAQAAPVVAVAAQSIKSAKNTIININTASEKELASLPGIGDKKAALIIAARPFKTTEELKKVKGIKEEIYSKIKSNISVQ